MNKEKPKNDRLAALAQHTLQHFEETVTRVRDALAEKQPTAVDVFATMNVATDTAAINAQRSQSTARLRELHSLAHEPAIARVLTKDEGGNRRTYFVSRATPHRPPSDGSLAVSYNSTPLGRLASLPVGGELEAKTRHGLRTLTVLERTLLRPREADGLWDSINSVVEGKAFGPFTIASLRALLDGAGVPADDLDALEAALAADRAAALVVEGLRRDALTKMELRDLAVLDQYQDEIFRLPLDSRLVILGPPGTGKTTTLIKRLAQKLDQPNLTEEERETISATAAGAARHEASWIMFTPTSLLKRYITKAFAHENIAATDDRIQTWDDCRRDLARNRHAILRSATGRGQFVMKDSPPSPSLLPATVAAQRTWFEDFDAWQLDAFWSDLRTHAETLSSDKSPDVSRLGTRLHEALPEEASSLNADAVSNPKCNRAA